MYLSVGICCDRRNIYVSQRVSFLQLIEPLQYIETTGNRLYFRSTLRLQNRCITRFVSFLGTQSRIAKISITLSLKLENCTKVWIRRILIWRYCRAHTSLIWFFMKRNLPQRWFCTSQSRKKYSDRTCNWFAFSGILWFLFCVYLL